MAALKVVAFPGIEEIAYSTEKKTNTNKPNPVIEFLADRPSVTREELYTIEKITSKHLHGEKIRRRFVGNGREFICPPILELSMDRKTSEPVCAKPKRIFNGFFPSKIRTSTSPCSSNKTKFCQELYEELVPDATFSPNQNGPYTTRTGAQRNWTKHHTAPRGITRQDQKVVYTLRNGAPSPWINRYQLKKSNISIYNANELKNNSTDKSARGFSR